jgi:hypothetical protein
MGSAADKLADQLNDAESQIEDLQEEIERLRAMLPLTEHYELDDDAPDLPIPRLELVWCEGSPSMPRYDWCCRYNLVYRHFADGKWDGAPGTVSVPMGYTGVGGSGTPHDVGELGMPFRDGAHATHDAKHLGLPLYVRHGDRYRKVDIE